MCGDIALLIKVLEELFQKRATRPLVEAGGFHLELAVELGRMQCAAQLYLVADPTKPRHHCWQYPATTWLPEPNSYRGAKECDTVFPMEARQHNLTATPTSLLDELSQATEDQLLALRYAYNDGQMRGVVAQLNRLGRRFRYSGSQFCARLVKLFFWGRGVNCRPTTSMNTQLSSNW